MSFGNVDSVQLPSPRIHDLPLNKMALINKKFQNETDSDSQLKNKPQAKVFRTDNSIQVLAINETNGYSYQNSNSDANLTFSHTKFPSSLKLDVENSPVNNDFEMCKNDYDLQNIVQKLNNSRHSTPSLKLNTASFELINREGSKKSIHNDNLFEKQDDNAHTTKLGQIQKTHKSTNNSNEISKSRGDV